MSDYLKCYLLIHDTYDNGSVIVLLKYPLNSDQPKNMNGQYLCLLKPFN